MERTEILKKLTEIAQDAFDNDTVELTEATTAADVDIEDEFQVKFTLAEITGSQNIGELLDALISHM